jgi:acylpyruvate hydrolase
VRPRGIDVHFEIELAVVMGKRLKDLEASDEKGALDAIGGKF